MKKDLILRLLVPLLLLTIASLIAHTYIENDSFFINLSTELIGIIITVAYVDWAFRRQHTKDWQGVDERVVSRLQFFINTAITDIRLSLKYGTDIFDRKKLSSKDPEIMKLELMRVSKEVLEPTTQQRIESFDHESWEHFTRRIERILQETDNLISLYESRVHPDQYSILLDIQNAARHILKLYAAFPDVISNAVTKEMEAHSPSLPPNIKKRFVSKDVGNELRGLLQRLRELSGKL